MKPKKEQWTFDEIVAIFRAVDRKGGYPEHEYEGRALLEEFIEGDLDQDEYDSWPGEDE